MQSKRLLAQSFFSNRINCRLAQNKVNPARRCIIKLVGLNHLASDGQLLSFNKKLAKEIGRPNGPEMPLKTKFLNVSKLTTPP